MRPTAKAKAGYYPAPPSIVTALGRYITNPHLQPGRLLDPCAGEGLAAALLLKQFPALDGYAIELDKCRAEQCRARLTHVLRSDAHVVKMQRDSINLLFLNSPYDTERGGLRTEFTWLKRWTPMLQPKGVLVYVIPDAQYSEQVLPRAVPVSVPGSRISPVPPNGLYRHQGHLPQPLSTRTDRALESPQKAGVARVWHQ